MDHILFPFLSLPQKAQVRVLNTMRYDEIDILSFSFCSKRTKDLAISLNLSAASADIYVHHGIRITFLTFANCFQFEFYRGTDFEETDESIPLPLPDQTVIVINKMMQSKFEHVTWRKSEYEFRDWVENILTVFHYSRIDKLSFQESHGRFDANSISEALKRYDIVNLVIGGPTDEMARIATRKALEVFPNTEDICIQSDPYDEAGLIQKVLIRNYDQMEVLNPPTFNDLLIVNSLVIKIYDCDWSEKFINRLIKLWIRGSHPRLQHLNIQFPTKKDEGLILKGIKHTKTPDYQRRSFRISFSTSCYVEAKVRGGYDIRRLRDGTLATITVTEHSGLHWFDMYIWSG